MRRAVASPNAPRPLGPYSPALRTGSLLFISGQVPVDPASGEIVGRDIAAQTEQVMRNIGTLLTAAGLGFEHLVKTTVFLTDLEDFKTMNDCYGRFMPDPPPARATVQVARLPRDVRIEIDAIAEIP